MPSGKPRIAVFALIGLSALLIGFHGASTLMTLTQVAASPGKPQQPRAHASLVPRPAIPVQVSEPARTVPTEVRADRPAPSPVVQNPVPERVIQAEPAQRPAVEAVAQQLAAGNLATFAATATAQADLAGVPMFTEEPAPRRERPRRYRAQRPELHRVY